MQTGVVTILGIDQKSGVGKTGKPYTLYNVKASDGNTYTTFEAPLAQQAGQTNGAPVTLEYDQRPNGQYMNYDLKAVYPAAGAVPDAPAHAVASVNGAPPQLPVVEASTFQQEKDARITRLSAASTAFQYAAAAGIGAVEALALAVTVEHYANGGPASPGAYPDPEPVVPAQSGVAAGDSIPWS